MKNSGLFVTALLLSISSGAFAADASFDRSVGDVLETVDTLKAPPQGGGHQQPGPGGNHGGNMPQPPAPQPNGNITPGQVLDIFGAIVNAANGGQPQHGGNQDGHNPGNHGNPGGNNNHGNPGWDNNHGNDQGPGNHHPENNNPAYECSDWTFKSDTPNPFTDKIYFYDTQNRMQSEKVTINIGARDLKPWESEEITVCSGSLAFDKSLFNYSVTQKDTSGFGSFFTSEKSYEYALTPAGRKASSPDSQGLTMEASGVSADNKIYMTLKDKWASFYQGQQLTLKVKIMRVPDAAALAGMSTQELLDALKETTFTVTYPVSDLYQVQLLDRPATGMYMVTVDYVRDGSNINQLFTVKI